MPKPASARWASPSKTYPIAGAAHPAGQVQSTWEKKSIFLCAPAFAEVRSLFHHAMESIEIGRNADQLFLFNLPFVLLHEILICEPRNSGSFDSVPLGPHRDLMRVKVMEAKLVEQRFLHNRMRQEE